MKNRVSLLGFFVLQGFPLSQVVDVQLGLLQLEKLEAEKLNSSKTARGLGGARAPSSRQEPEPPCDRGRRDGGEGKEDVLGAAAAH